VSKIDLEYLSKDLGTQGVNIDSFVHCDITLTEAIRYSSTQDNELLKMVEYSILNLKTSADIVNIVDKVKIKPESRKEFLKLWASAINCALINSKGLVNEQVVNYIKENYKIEVMIKILKIIDEAVRKVESNVNFNYVLDQLFYSILKEKYLCK
jgi:hypothetical protein